jgi:isochorismate pyruvate lyase
MRAPETCYTIEDVRTEIDQIDRDIVEAIARRRHYVKSIMRFKQDEADVQAPERQAQVITMRRQWAEELALNPDLVEQIFRTMISHFISEELEMLERRRES